VSTQGQDSSDSQPAEKRADGRWTIGELLAWTTTKLKALGIVDARVDAEYLLASSLGCRRLDLYLAHDRLLDAEERAGFRDLVRRRLSREPVAYIEGQRGFHGLALDLSVDRRVLIPRADTELLVDWVLEELPIAAQEAGANTLAVLDVGTGSGAIALALKHARPDLMVHAVDTSEDALAVARENARRLNLDIKFSRSDLLAGVQPPSSRFAAVVANLPYIPSADILELAPEVRDFEPRLALDGGADGLDLIRRLIEGSDWAKILAEGGLLALEFGIHQAPAIRDLLAQHGWVEIEVRRDYGGIERCIVAKRTALPSGVERKRDVVAREHRDRETLAEKGDAKELAGPPDTHDYGVEWVVVPDERESSDDERDGDD
jgi:release factor glutamine methyltransferase